MPIARLGDSAIEKLAFLVFEAGRRRPAVGNGSQAPADLNNFDQIFHRTYTAIQKFKHQRNAYCEQRTKKYGDQYIEQNPGPVSVRLVLRRI